MYSATERARSSSWTVLSLIEWASDHLQKKGFDESRLHVELMLAHVLHTGRMNLYLEFDRPLSRDELAGFKALFTRRLTREPLQYILGDVEFHGLHFAIDRRALIPRPETEYLVEHALEFLRGSGQTAPRILDIGAGSGVIAISLAQALPEAVVVGIDASVEALSLATENAHTTGTRNVQFLRADFYHEFLTGDLFDCIVSNPPYVPAAELAVAQAEVRDYEPEAALTDGGDGLGALRRIIQAAPAKLAPGGRVMLEIGHDQWARVREALIEAGIDEVTVIRDFAGIERFATGVKSF